MEVRIIEENQLSLIPPNTRIHHFFDFYKSSSGTFRPILDIKTNYEIHVQNVSDIGRILELNDDSIVAEVVAVHPNRVRIAVYDIQAFTDGEDPLEVRVLHSHI